MRGKKISLKEARNLSLRISRETDERLRKEREDMIKQFCDMCMTEIDRNYVSNRLKMVYCPDAGNPDMPTIIAEVMVEVNGICNHGDLCRNCLFEVLTHGVDLNEQEKEQTSSVSGEGSPGTSG